MPVLLRIPIAVCLSILLAAPLATGPAAASKEAFGEKMTLMGGAVDCQPTSDVDYVASQPGAVRVQSGSAYFACGMQFPVGTKIIKVIVYLNPMGSNVAANFGRYRLLPPVYDDLASKYATTNTGVEPVVLKVNHIVKGGWSYRIHNILMSSTNEVVLHGYKVIYQLPK